MESYWYYKDADTYIPSEIDTIFALDHVNCVTFVNGEIKPASSIYTSVTNHTPDSYHKSYCHQVGDKWIYGKIEHRKRRKRVIEYPKLNSNWITKNYNTLYELSTNIS